MEVVAGLFVGIGISVIVFTLMLRRMGRELQDLT
jgi:hypothetical protein